MRKVILTIILIIMILLSILLINNGLSGPLKIYGFKEINEKNNLITEKLSELSIIKAEDFKLVESDFKKACMEYDSAYKKYSQVAGTKTTEEKKKAVLDQTYDLEYLWVSLGNYADEAKCDLTLEVSKNSTEATDGTYEMCDLKFEVVGAYSGIIDFMESIARDPELKFIPENLNMYSEYRRVRLIDQDNNSQEEGTKKLMLVTEFYKTNIPVSKNTILKIEEEPEVYNRKVEDSENTINININSDSKLNINTSIKDEGDE